MILLLPIGGWFYYQSRIASARSVMGWRPIKVGILYSLNDELAADERSVAEATLMAIDEINRSGGLLGRRVVPIVVGGSSDRETFAAEAEKLIKGESVSAIFGCCTSASRKIIKPVIEKYDHLLFYPVQYEGLEQSPNIVYMGAAPNQQIIPAVKWCFDNLGWRFFLVGSDYVYSRTVNEIIRDQVTALRGEIVGEEYLPLGSIRVLDVIAKIVDKRPTVILNTLNGVTNAAFFTELRVANVGPKDIPTMSFSVTEEVLAAMGAEHLAGDFACRNYFQTVDTKENKKFVRDFKARYGAERVTDDTMEAGYFGVYLWAQAVEEAGTDDPARLRETIKNQSLYAPEGMVYVSPENNHTWKTVRIGRIRRDGQFDIVWSSDKPVQPRPFPIYRSRTEWYDFLLGLYENYENDWASPGVK